MRFIWTQRAIDKASKGGSDPRHTISAPNVENVYDGFVRQLRAGTPWQLRDANDQIVAHGVA